MTLVVMAAGLGSRYGGCKQIDGVGPSGEILLEYSVYDAVRAGFSRIVFIIKQEMHDVISALCAGAMSRLKTPDGQQVSISYVYQDYSSVPQFYKIPAERSKPFGTVHAVLCAKSEVNEPFAVINADDFYGAEAFAVMYGALRELAPTGEACMVGYRLKNTVSENGTVTRGVCSAESGLLRSVTETYKILAMPDGSIRDCAGSDEGRELDPEALVSMNFWGYTPWIFGAMEKYFDDFLCGLAPGDVKSECLLPIMTDGMIRSGELAVRVLQTDGRWFGMTYIEDRAEVASELAKLHACGTYPPSLR